MSLTVPVITLVNRSSHWYWVLPGGAVKRHYDLVRRFVVSIRERVIRLLDRGSAEVDPDEFVEFAVVHVATGPLLVERLREAGIDAEGHDTFNVVTQALSDYSVRVRRRDLTAAAHVHDV
jgi:hypothetical protein